MPTTDRLRRYGFALLTILLGAAASRIPFVREGNGTLAILCLLAVALSSRYGGLGPGLFATLVIAALTAHPGFQTWRIVRLALFVGGGIFISALAEGLHAARRRAESSQRRLEAVLTSIGDAVIATDERGRVTFANPVAQELTGWGPDDAVGAPLDKVFRVFAEDSREAIEPPASRVIREGTAAELANHTLLVARDGRERPIADSAAPIRDRSGRIAGVVLVFRDVTAQRLAERDRAELLARAEAARAEAEAANRAKDRFLAVLSHELRTPLTPVLMSVSAHLEDPGLPAPLRSTLELTRRNVELESHLIDDLLDISRIIRGKFRLERQAVDLHDLIHQAVATCREDVDRGPLRLELDLSAAEPTVEGDPARLQQVLWNLIKNAVKFTGPGGRIAIRTRNETRAEGGGLPGGCRTVVEVSDTGIGIRPGDESRIFEAFEQGEASAWSRRSGGLGLGLAIGRAIAEAHGGRLTAHSAGPDRGATFTLDLATLREAAPGPQMAAPAPDRAGPCPGLRILLVEDDEPTLRVLARLLRHRGHTVHAASSVAAALEVAGREELDLLVSDLGLPDGNGLELLRALRARRPITAIALSGYGTDDDVRRSRDAGFAAHLTKPVDLQRLEAAIRQAADPR